MGSCRKKIFTEKEQSYSVVYFCFDYILSLCFFLDERKGDFVPKGGENLFSNVFFNIFPDYISYRIKL